MEAGGNYSGALETGNEPEGKLSFQDMKKMQTRFISTVTEFLSAVRNKKPENIIAEKRKDMIAYAQVFLTEDHLIWSQAGQFSTTPMEALMNIIQFSSFKVNPEGIIARLNHVINSSINTHEMETVKPRLIEKWKKILEITEEFHGITDRSESFKQKFQDLKEYLGNMSELLRNYDIKKFESQLGNLATKTVHCLQDTTISTAIGKKFLNAMAAEKIINSGKRQSKKIFIYLMHPRTNVVEKFTLKDAINLYMFELNSANEAFNSQISQKRKIFNFHEISQVSKILKILIDFADLIKSGCRRFIHGVFAIQYPTFAIHEAR